MRKIEKLILCCLTLAFVGCTSGAGNKGDHGSENNNSAIEKETSVSQSEASDTTNTTEPSGAPVLVRDIASEINESDAVSYLLNEAERALDNKEIDRAIALADRAIQVERKSPRAYLILAQAYYAENKLGLVVELAKQGLLYAAENSPVGKKLLRLSRLK